MHWRIFGVVAITIFLTALFHFYVSKETNKLRVTIGLCLAITIALFGVFLTLEAQLEKGYVRKEDLRCLWSESDDFLYVKGYDTRVKLSNFDTFEEAKKAGGACVVYDMCCSPKGTPPFWTIDFDDIPGGTLPAGLLPTGDMLSESVHSCAAGFITTFV